MMRAVMTPVLLGVLVTAMVAGGVPAGCSSRPLGHKNVDAAASVPDAPAGGGGVAGSGSEAAAAGSGDNGGVTSSGGSASGGSAGGGSTDARGGIDASAEKPRPTEGTPLQVAGRLRGVIC